MRVATGRWRPARLRWARRPADISRMSGLRRSLALLLIAAVALSGLLLYAFDLERGAAVRAAETTQSAQATLTAMLDQETGVRGYLYAGDRQFLQPYLAGRAAYEQGRIRVGRAAAGDERSRQLAAAQDDAARAWQALAERMIAARGSLGGGAKAKEILVARGKRQMDEFRSFNGQLLARLAQRRDTALRRTGDIATVVVVGLAALLAMSGVVTLHRRTRRTLYRSEREVAYRERQREFSDLIQAVDTEDQAHDLVQRHLSRSLPQAVVTVLKRNNSDNRLHPHLLAGQTAPVAPCLDGSEPRDCLAIRLGRPHAEDLTHDRLLSCGICCSVAGSTSCRPLLVAGNVIGSVLIGRDEALTEDEDRTVTDTVAQAAPALANLRAIAVAESRASTDALTGLPNRRAMTDTLKRMTAHAGRTAQPLAAIAFDLDRFKTINDRYGHDMGDTALSTVGECLRGGVRQSDFAARIGGEEFLVLAPDTDIVGARRLAEKLREAIAATVVPALQEPVTASFGVAVMPDHAATADALLRRADKASYAAKERGRNRVELAGADEDVRRPAPTMLA